MTKPSRAAQYFFTTVSLSSISQLAPIDLMNKTHWTTFELARLLGVAPDTVLRWVRAGTIDAVRTFGGHFRIEAGTVERLLKDQRDQKHKAILKRLHKVPLYCWEFWRQQGIRRPSCERCLAYKARASYCFELARLPKRYGHLKIYCKASSCRSCDYYQFVKERMPKR